MTEALKDYTAGFGTIKAMADEFELWLGGRETGPVFTRMRQGRGDMRNAQATDMPMTTRSVRRLLGRYPIWIDGELRAVTPHDLRRSYARNLFSGGDTGRGHPAESGACGCQDNAGLHWRASWLRPGAGERL